MEIQSSPTGHTFKAWKPQVVLCCTGLLKPLKRKQNLGDPGPEEASEGPRTDRLKEENILALASSESRQEDQQRGPQNYTSNHLQFKPCEYAGRFGLASGGQMCFHDDLKVRCKSRILGLLEGACGSAGGAGGAYPWPASIAQGSVPTARGRGPWGWSPPATPPNSVSPPHKTVSLSPPSVQVPTV